MFKEWEVDSRCHACGGSHDRASGFEHSRQPRPGDVTVCMACAAINVFDEHLCLRAPTPEELIEFRTSPALRRLQRAVSITIDLRRREN